MEWSYDDTEDLLNSHSVPEIVLCAKSLLDAITVNTSYLNFRRDPDYSELYQSLYLVNCSGLGFP
jgi:hypothetical protein